MIIDYKKLGDLANQETVYATGTFDLIHIGHMYFFEFIKSACPNAKLVVGVAPDERVRFKKGQCRPTLSQDERLRMVDCIKHVDYAFIYPIKNYGKDNPIIEVIDTLKPKYYISKPERSTRYLEELRDRNVKVVVIPHDRFQSTTNIINKVLDNHKGAINLI